MEEFIESFITKEKLPLVITPRNKNIDPRTFLRLLSQYKEIFKQKLITHGGILFRDFPVLGEHDFAAVVKHLEIGDFLNYIGGDSPRTKVADGVYTSTEAPPSVKIPLHNELSFVKYYPKYICFHCVIPSPVGGETILGDSRTMYTAIDPVVRERFDQKGLRYISAYYDKSKLMEFINKIQPSHKSWHQVFETVSKEDVERLCRQHEFDLEWHKNNWLQIAQTRPATISHPVSNEKVWFNQAHLYDFNPRLLGWWRYLGAKFVYHNSDKCLHSIFFGDQTPVPRSDIYHVMDVLDANTIAFPWHKGDIIILDNILTMHGRATFTGKRRILTAMCG